MTWIERLNNLERLLMSSTDYVKPTLYNNVRIPRCFEVIKDYQYDDLELGKVQIDRGDILEHIKDQPTYYSNGLAVLQGGFLWTSRDYFKPIF